MTKLQATRPNRGTRTSVKIGLTMLSGTLLTGGALFCREHHQAIRGAAQLE